MSFVGSMFNGQNGSGYHAQGQAGNILLPTTSDQAQQAYQQSQGGIGQQQAFLNALAAQGGIGQQQALSGQIGNTANQLQAMTQGQGPNPALAQLNQSTGQNVANQAALMASQRGASANPGMIARLAAQQGAATQQQAAGQAATLQAQQQLAAYQALQQQQALQAQQANQMVGQQGTALQNLNQFGQGEQNQLLGAIQGQNSANVAMQSNINNANAGIAQGNQKFQQGVVGGALNGASAVAGLAHGGQVRGPRSHVGQFFKGRAAQSMKQGGRVPGQAKVSGDSSKNDTVPAMLSPKEIVLPRSVTLSKDAPDKAAAFVSALMAKKKMGARK